MMIRPAPRSTVENEWAGWAARQADERATAARSAAIVAAASRGTAGDGRARKAWDGRLTPAPAPVGRPSQLGRVAKLGDGRFAAALATLKVA